MVDYIWDHIVVAGIRSRAENAYAPGAGSRVLGATSTRLDPEGTPAASPSLSHRSLLDERHHESVISDSAGDERPSKLVLGTSNRGAAGCWGRDCVRFRVASIHDRADPDDHDPDNNKRLGIRRLDVEVVGDESRQLEVVCREDSLPIYLSDMIIVNASR